MTKPSDWRVLTPVIVSLTPILLGIIGWFLVNTLLEVKTDIQKQTEKIELISEKFNAHSIQGEGRYSKLETEISNINSRITRLEFNKGNFAHGS